MAQPPVDTDNTHSGTITKPKKPPYYIMALMLLPLFAGGLTFAAMMGIQSTGGAGAWFKAGLVALAAALVSYCVNRFAIDWGAELTANGFVSAGIFSVASILSVGACLWAFTYAGITLFDVDHLELEGYAQTRAQQIDRRIDNSATAATLVPAVRAVQSDLDFHAACEIKESCVSGRGNGGRGSIARVLEERAHRASDILAQLEAGLARRDGLVKSLNALSGQFLSVLGSGDDSAKEKRRRLITIDAQVSQTLAALDKAIPLGLMAAYAGELKTGVQIPGRPEATRAVNALLAKNGTTLENVLSRLELKPAPHPAFPGRAGIADTFSYIGHFAAVAGVIWVAEGVFPFALWLYSLLYLLRKRNWETDTPEYSMSASKSIAMNGGLDADRRAQNDVVTPLSAQPDKRTRRSNRHRGRTNGRDG